jgi:fucose permease
MMPDTRLVRRLRRSGILVGLGLLVAAATLFWPHPTAFLVFLGVGGLLVGAGVLLYLFAIAAGPAEETPGSAPTDG